MIRINLLSEGRQPAVARRKVSLSGSGNLGNYALIGLALVALLAGLLHWYLKSSELKRVRQEVDRLAPIIREVEEFKAKKAEMERKIGVIRDLRRNQYGPVQIMDEVSRALPDLMWLTSMTQKSNKVTLQGEAFNTNAVATFIDNLDQVPEFQEPNLKDTNRRGTRGGNSFRFVIDFNYSPPKPAGD